jgi:hypothetical protein
MGVSMADATKALTYCEARSIEDAIDFLFPHPGGRYHHFTRFPMAIQLTEDEKLIDVFLCLQCGLREKDHPPVHGPGGVIVPVLADDLDHPLILIPQQRRPPGPTAAERALAEAAEEEKKRAAALAEGKLSCSICTGYDFTEADFVVPPCNHRFCKACVVGFLEANINSGTVKELRCMDADCRRIMDEKEIESLVSAPVWSKFQRFTEQIRLQSDPAVRFCPRPNCGEVMRGSQRQPHLKCGKCAFEMCWRCNKPWHGSISCDKVIANSNILFISHSFIHSLVPVIN